MLFSALAEAGLPAVCVETRHMQAVLKAQINKTDRNDARGMAQMGPIPDAGPAEDGIRCWSTRRCGATSGMPARLSVPLYETEAVAKRIAAEGRRAVLGVFEHLLLLGT